MFTRIMVLALSFPRSGLALTRGAGAPLLLPEFARSSGREGGKGTKRRGFARPRQSRRGEARSAHADLASILHGASQRRGEEGRGDRFFPCEGERAAPSFPP
ncbi:hypothetical protein GFM07_19215 [Rhizobium leguminosarum bv. viciae]|nr:hypothetical protein [Rhizobium leguminosarum bv. viciae]NKL56885.1 hypothetical protein [Rhizobium leguminosarum bv. viciae]